MTGLQAITLDLWGTILQPRDAEAKIERRLALLLEALAEARCPVDAATLREAYQAAEAILEANIGTQCRDIGPLGCWRVLAERLGLPPTLVPTARLVAAYEDLTLEFLPGLMPGAGAAIQRLAGAYRLALICNTMYTRGQVLREVLRRHGLADCFQAFIFSDEVGCVKPEPRIFRQALAQLGVEAAVALHVGEVEALDAQGARAAGMRAARYLPSGPAPTGADLVFHHWDDFEARLASWAATSPARGEVGTVHGG
ncbi:MAG TPA: HAD family hydrolase [Chloroflexota bacterium]|nr:HAD family hydrolase [Chloroflexota bacterium]